MKKPEGIKLKYFLRGLGMGIMVTIIIMALHGLNEKKIVDAPMTKEEILEKAKEYGLVEPMDDKLDQILNSASPEDITSPSPSPEE